MKYFYLIILYFILIKVDAQQKQTINPNGYNIFYYENGMKSSEGPMRDGKPDGYWKVYSVHAKIKSEGNRKNFQLDSIWKFYDDDGKLAFEYYYKDGKKNGSKKMYDIKNNILISDENYENDIKQGSSLYYYADGKVSQKIPFNKGKEEGIGFEYDEAGNIITIIEYKLGFIKKQEKINRRDRNNLKQGMWKEFYENGNVKNECNYTDDKKNGYYKEYSMNGSLSNTIKYVNGKIENNAPELTKLDIKTEYYEGGIVKYTGGYKDGVPEGIHREYSIEGKIVNSKIFKEGILTGEGILDEQGHEQGLWKEYHPNGQLKSQGEYKDGKRIGEWIFYYPNGQIEQKGKYDKKGRAQDVWKWYYEDGKLLREETYVDDLRDGLMTEYNDTGTVITKGEFIEGQKEKLWVYELGDYKEEGNYKEDKRDGAWKHYYTNNGKLRFEGKYIDGNPDGKHVYYYPDGKVKEDGRYIVGRKEGDWKYYSEDGTLFLTILYKDDVEIKFDGVKVKTVQEETEQKGTPNEGEKK